MMGMLPARSSCIALLAIVAASGCAARAPARSFADLQHRVSAGATVYVIDNTGTEIRGRLKDISSTGLVLGVDGSDRRIDADTVRQVQRYGDSLWNGLLIGMAVATPGMLIADPTYDRCSSDPSRLCANSRVGQRIVAVGVSGAIGAAIDAAIRSRHQIYLSPDQQPHHAGDLRPAPGTRQLAGGIEGVMLPPDHLTERSPAP
jgi:hypothetical protein